MQYAWLIWSLILLAIWVIVYFSLRSAESRKEMLTVSLWTSLFGLSEPIFVPLYWNPPSLFNLAQKIGFDIESLIFAFAVGGLAVVIYELLFKVKHERILSEEKHRPHHKYHLLALLSSPIIFLILLFSTNLNPIYSVFIAFIGGGLFTLYCRPDLKNKMIASAFIFLSLYFLYFLTLEGIFPGYVEQVWNLEALSKILIIGVPLEELIFAFSFGFFWSSVHEHIKWYRIKELT